MASLDLKYKNPLIGPQMKHFRDYIKCEIMCTLCKVYITFDDDGCIKVEVGKTLV